MIHDEATACRGRMGKRVVSSRTINGNPTGGRMRASRSLLALTVLLAAGAAQGAEPVKIRASWIVAPSDWTPLLPEKPELMKNNGKTYLFEPMRFQGTPAVITALANNEIELGNLAFSSLALAIQN